MNRTEIQDKLATLRTELNIIYRKNILLPRDIQRIDEIAREIHVLTENKI